jgi:PRTRC genetic system ThiF family protein
VHLLHPALLTRAVRVLVVGCGGTGSAVLSGLPFLHMGMKALGHPHGLSVTAMDGSVVTTANCVRQVFSPADVGSNKAVVLMNRINPFWGLRWRALPARLGPTGETLAFDLVISCVDTRAARRVIHDRVDNSPAIYWLDLGNTDQKGQYILGQPRTSPNRLEAQRLPMVAELYPDMIDPSLDDDDLPSCSQAESIERQGMFLNRLVATHALNLLEHLFRFGQVSHHAEFLDPAGAIYSRIPVDVEAWREIKQQHRIRRRLRERAAVLA